MEDTYFSDKVHALKTGVFATLNQKKTELIQRGRKVYNLSVGTPNFSTGTAYYESNGGCMQESGEL